MRPASARVARALTGSHRVSSTAAVYYDGVPVLPSLPISDGSLTLDRTQDVPGSLSLAVPRYLPTDGAPVDLLPTGPASPLSADGARVAVAYTVHPPGSEPETIPLGWYRIDDWAEGDDGTLDVAAISLETTIQEARFLNPVQIAKNTTYAAAARAIVGRLVPLKITAEPAKVTAGQTFEEDRLAALDTLISTWPARRYMDTAGTLVIADPDDTTTPVAELTDGTGGTVVKAPRSGSRAEVYNAVKASGESSGDTAPVSAVAYLATGPRRWNGPFGNVPYFYTSPLLTTRAQCLKAARTRLANLQVTAAPVTIESAPDPRIEPGDTITLTHDGRRRRLVVDAVTLPLTYAGTMTITGHEV